ncbi:hypothetical protein [Bradyrhizobium diazoefficiens]
MTTTERDIADALNALADKLNAAAATLDAIGSLPVVDALRIAPGSPLARMVEQGKQFAKIMPEPGKVTTWTPEWPN